jgi:hypothetical protein
VKALALEALRRHRLQVVAGHLRPLPLATRRPPLPEPARRPPLQVKARRHPLEMAARPRRPRRPGGSTTRG